MTGNVGSVGYFVVFSTFRIILGNVINAFNWKKSSLSIILSANIYALWCDVKIVHGKLQYNQNQGSVERTNRDVEDMFGTWMALEQK